MWLFVYRLFKKGPQTSYRGNVSAHRARRMRQRAKELNVEFQMTEPSESGNVKVSFAGSSEHVNEICSIE